MFEGPIDDAFFGFVVFAMGITALRPQWTIYVLTYGHPELAAEYAAGWRVVRVIAGFCAVSLIADFVTSLKMFDGPIDQALVGVAALATGITAARPQWTIYVLTFGHPERTEEYTLEFKVVRVIATFCAIGMIVDFIFGL